MKLKRSDPSYREIERQRDRERRRVARMNNPDQRAIERERDRQYKRRARQTATAIENTVAEEVTLPMTECVAHNVNNSDLTETYSGLTVAENLLVCSQPDNIITILNYKHG